MNDYSEMTRAERIKARRNKLKLSPSYVGQYVGVTRVTYLNWEEGKVNDIAWPKFNKLAEVLLTTPEWLEYGRAWETYVSNDASGDIKKSLSGTHVIKSPVIPTFELNKDDKTLIRNKGTDLFVDMPAKSGDFFAIQLKYESPMMRSHAGDAMIMDGNAEPVPGEEVFIETKVGDCHFFVFNYKRDNEFNLTAEQGKVIFNTEDIQEIAPVVAVARNSYVKRKPGLTK